MPGREVERCRAAAVGRTLAEVGAAAGGEDVDRGARQGVAPVPRTVPSSAKVRGRPTVSPVLPLTAPERSR